MLVSFLICSTSLFIRTNYGGVEIPVSIPDLFKKVQGMIREEFEAISILKFLPVFFPMHTSIIAFY
jgi:hypothetical protein